MPAPDTGVSIGSSRAMQKYAPRPCCNFRLALLHESCYNQPTQFLHFYLRTNQNNLCTCCFDKISRRRLCLIAQDFLGHTH